MRQNCRKNGESSTKVSFKLKIFKVRLSFIELQPVDRASLLTGCMSHKNTGDNYFAEKYSKLLSVTASNRVR